MPRDATHLKVATPVRASRPVPGRRRNNDDASYVHIAMKKKRRKKFTLQDVAVGHLWRCRGKVRLVVARRGQVCGGAVRSGRRWRDATRCRVSKRAAEGATEGKVGGVVGCGGCSAGGGPCVIEREGGKVVRQGAPSHERRRERGSGRRDLRKKEKR
jgi:hypothetical protein